MFGLDGAVDQNVIKEHQGKPLYRQLENRLHEGLKRQSQVLEAKGHAKKFVMPFVHLKPCTSQHQGNVCLLDDNLNKGQAWRRPEHRRAHQGVL